MSAEPYGQYDDGLDPDDENFDSEDAQALDQDDENFDSPYRRWLRSLSIDQLKAISQGDSGLIKLGLELMRQSDAQQE